MVLVSFSGVVIKDLTPIADLGSDVFQEFVNYALANVFGQKTSAKAISRVAAALSIDAELVHKAILAVAAVLIESAKQNASDDDFATSLSDLRLTVDNAAALHSAYKSNSATLREYLASSSLQLPSYADLDWRLDIEVSSRALRQEVKPQFLLELKTHPGGSAEAQGGAGVEAQSKYLQSDYATLQRIADELTKAVAEAKSGHARRIMRYVK